jgi:regulator of protease activity HflC (stomatin/prohibitin superfamily)
MPWTPDNLLIVRETERAVIYKDGIYSETLGPGRHYLPKRYRFFTRTCYPIYNIFMVDVSEREVIVEDLGALSTDEKKIGLNAIMDFRVSDPARAVMRKEKYEDRLKRDAQIAIEQVSSGLTAQAIKDDRDAFRQAVLDRLRPLAMDYGVDILGLKLTAIKPKKDEKPKDDKSDKNKMTLKVDADINIK